MKDWKEVKREINLNKIISSDYISSMDRTIYHYIQKMCKNGCKFYQGKCNKNRNITECARKGLKNKE